MVDDSHYLERSAQPSKKLHNSFPILSIRSPPRQQQLGNDPRSVRFANPLVASRPTGRVRFVNPFAARRPTLVGFVSQNPLTASLVGFVSQNLRARSLGSFRNRARRPARRVRFAKPARPVAGFVSQNPLANPCSARAVLSASIPPIVTKRSPRPAGPRQPTTSCSC